MGVWTSRSTTRRASGRWMYSSTSSSTSGGLTGTPAWAGVIAPGSPGKPGPGVFEVGEVIDFRPFVVADRNGVEANAGLHHPLKGGFVVAVGLARLSHPIERGPENRERGPAHLLYPDRLTG